MAGPAEPSSEHIAAAQDRIGHLAGLASRTHKAEQHILAAAEQRRVSVEADLAKLRDRVHTDPSAAQHYMDLTLERGRLDVIAAQARAVLSRFEQSSL